MRKFLACSVVGIAVFGGALVACSSGGGGRSQQAFCDALKKDQTFFNSLSDSSDLQSDKSESLAVSALTDLSNKAPDEIKDDMAKVAQFEKDFAAGKKSSVSETDLASAAANIDKFAKDKCGVDLGGASSDSSSSRSSSRSSSSSRDPFSDLSNLSDLSSLTSDFSDFSNFSDFSDLSSLSDLTSAFSSLSDLFSR
jgi:hypothetical protein